MKQLKLGQFSLGRLRSYLASERVSSDAVQGKHGGRQQNSVFQLVCQNSRGDLQDYRAVLAGTLLLSCQNNLRAGGYRV
jgi:hypothetical protein